MRRLQKLKAPASYTALAIALALAAGGAVALPGVANAQANDTAEQFAIPAGSLADALRAFSDRTGLQMVYSADIVDGKASSGVSGTMSRAEAMARILSGTGLTYRYSDGKTVIIEAMPSVAGGERMLGAVRVQGAQGGGSALAGATPVNGVNGSRDVTATEGTGSYTSNALTVGSKTAASIKDTPMAVSVITNQQLKDQNITDLNTAMRDAPGITVLHDSAGGLNFWSRGFQITQIQIDGGAPQNITQTTNSYTAFDNAGNYRPLIDLSLYDHVELVRGATGTFNAYGDPGGVINLVRKRPLDHAQMTIDMQLGSWDWHRVSADVTGPLAFGGKLRGRIIATHQDNNYFYDIAKASRNVVSGTVDFDLTPTTLLTAGVTYQDQNDITWSGGLPRYQTGKVVDFPRGRATCLCLPWAINNARNLEYFGQIDQRIGDKWTLKVKLNRVQQKSESIGVGIYGAVDPILGTGPYIDLSPYTRGRVKQTQIEATLDGSFRMFGQIQKLVIGANYSMESPAGSTDSGPDDTSATPYFANGLDNDSKIGDVRKFDPYAWQPGLTYGKYPYRGWEYADFRVMNAYASFDLTPFARFHINTAIRYSQSRSRGLMYFICRAVDAAYISPDNDCQGNVGKKISLFSGAKVGGNDFSWPPSVQLRYDLTDDISAHLIYTDIYVDRSHLVSDKGVSLTPITGKNFEGGLKWLSPSKKLNANISGYYTKQVNVGYIQTSDGGSPIGAVGQLNKFTSCCFINDDGAYNISYGVDFEVAGEVAKGLQLSASYTYNYNVGHFPHQFQFDGSRPPLQSRAPRHLAKLWATYAFGEGSTLKGLRLGLGAQARTSTFIVSTYCPVDPISSPDGPQCPYPPGQKLVSYTDPGYVVLSGSIGYRINDKLSFDAQFENLLDKTYFEQVGGLSGGNWYGSPRSVKVSLRGKF